MAAKKAAASKKQAKAKSPVEPADDGMVIDLDPATFNRAERRSLQHQFGLNFETLITTVNDIIFEKNPTASPPKDLDDGPVFADDVMIAMLTIVRKRTDPSASEADLDGMSVADLMLAVARGRAANPKG